MAGVFDVNAAIAKPNLLASVQQGYAFGTQQRQVREDEQRQNQLRTLAPRVIAGDQAAYEQASGIDYKAASELRSEGDNELRRLKGGMDYLRDAMASGNPQRIAAAEAQVGPYVSRIAGKPWTPGALTADPAAFEQAYARIAMVPAKDQEGDPAGFREAHMTAVAAGYAPGSPEYQKFMRVRGGIDPRAAPPGFAFVEEYNQDTGQTTKRLVQTRGQGAGGQGQAPSPAAPQPAPASFADSGGDPQMDALAQAANAMIKAGYSKEQVDAFMMQAAQSAPNVQVGPPTQQPDAPPSQQPVNNARLPSIMDVGGGEPALGPPGARFVTGPDNEQAAAQKRREAAATAQGGIEGRKAAGPDFEQEKAFRTEFRSAVAPSQDVVQQFQRVEGAAKNPSAAGDLSMIFAYMKMLDPGSVVREGEFANAQNAAGVPDQLVNLYNRAISGQRLNPTQRADFLQQAATLRDQAQLRIDEATAYYTEIAPEYGIDPSRVIRGAESNKPKSAPASSIDELVDKWAAK